MSSLGRLLNVHLFQFFVLAHLWYDKTIISNWSILYVFAGVLQVSNAAPGWAAEREGQLDGRVQNLQEVVPSPAYPAARHRLRFVHT